MLLSRAAGLRQASLGPVLTAACCTHSLRGSTPSPSFTHSVPSSSCRNLHTVTDRPSRTRRPAVEGQPEPSWLTEAESRHSFQRSDLHIVLVHPQIPQNTGNIARTCAATNIALHLVEPIGFELTDSKLKRAGLDYWKSVCVKTHASWQDFYTFFDSASVAGPKRLVAYSVHGSQYYAGPEFSYQPGDWLVFGAETSGLPEQAHKDIDTSGGALVKIPIVHTHVRSLNLAVSVGVAAFEAMRQLDAGKHAVAPRPPKQQQAQQADCAQP